MKLENYTPDGVLKTGASSSGITSLASGGTGADLSATGPGAVIQATTGAVFTVETALDETRGGTGQTTITAGDLLIGSASNVISKLAIGAAGKFLKVVAGLPAWADIFNQTLRDGGSDMTQRAAVNFVDGIGTTVTLTDDSGGGETEVKVDLALAVKENGSSIVATPDTLDWKDANVEDGGSNDVHIYQDLPGIAGGRLTGSTGVPVTTADVTGVTTLRYTPYLHDKISLFDGTRWKKFTFPETDFALTGLIKGVMYDIFGYNNSGTFTMESLAYKKVTATNSPTAGASKTINLSDTSTLVVGMEVTVRDGSGSEVSNITAVVSNTSITVDNLTNSYTLPDVYGYLARATAVTQQNGVWVKSGDATRRLLGSIRIDRATTGQTQDSATERLIVNAVNRVRKHLFCIDTVDSYTYTSTMRAANANVTYGQGRVGFASCLGDSLVIARNYSSVVMTGGGDSVGGVGLDATVTNHAQAGGASRGTVNGPVAHASEYAGYPSVGNHYLQRVEAANNATSCVWYGDNGGTLLKTASMQASVEV